MHSTTTNELTKYLAALNKANPVAPGVPFDLAWEWDGTDVDPMIRVYEQADGHDLCYGTEADILDNVRGSLEYWDLEDVVHYV